MATMVRCKECLLVFSHSPISGPAMSRCRDSSMIHPVVAGPW